MALRQFHQIMLAGAVVALINGCVTTPDNSNQGENLGWGTRALLCAGGGLAGGYIAKQLADKYFAKSGAKYTADEIELYTKGFQLGLFVTFCKLADYAGNTIYKKLSADGEKARREQVLQAVASAQTTTYQDPSNPSLRGTVTPLKRYEETTLNRECVDIEDTLADDVSTESIYVKYCRSLPNGAYQPVTV